MCEECIIFNNDNKRSRASWRASLSLLHQCPSKRSGAPHCGHSAVSSPESPSRLCPLPPSARPRCGSAARRDWHPCGACCLFRARRAQSGPAACSFPAGLQEAPPLSFLYMSRRQQPPDSPPPLAPAALDLPFAAAPRPGPMRGTGSRFGPSLLLPPHRPSARRDFPFPSPLLCSASLPSAAPGGKQRGGGCAWLGEPEGDFVGKHTMLVPGALSAGVLSLSYLAEGRDVFGTYLRVGCVCVRVLYSCAYGYLETPEAG